MSKPRLSSARLPSSLSVGTAAATEEPGPRERAGIPFRLPRGWRRAGGTTLGIMARGVARWLQAPPRTAGAGAALAGGGTRSRVFARSVGGALGALAGAVTRQRSRVSGSGAGIGVYGMGMAVQTKPAGALAGVFGAGSAVYIAADGDDELYLLELLPDSELLAL